MNVDLKKQLSGPEHGELLEAVAKGTKRIEKIVMPRRTIWIKRFGTEGPPRFARPRRILARVLRAPVLLPSPDLSTAEMATREARRIEEFRRAKVPVPDVIGIVGQAIVLSDVAPTIHQKLNAMADNDPVSHDDLIVLGAAELGNLHSQGLCHGRPFPRDMFIEDGRIGFLDFEEEPTAIMPVAVAQARDFLLYSLQVAGRSKMIDTFHNAYLNWAGAAPPLAVRELGKMNRWLSRFLGPARLLALVVHSRDLRHFIQAVTALKSEMPASGGTALLGDSEPASGADNNLLWLDIGLWATIVCLALVYLLVLEQIVG